MSQFGAVVGRLRPLFNRVTDAKLASRFFFALLAARLAAMTELACNTTFAVRQLANLKTACMDGAIDRGVAYLTGAVFQLCPVCYLLRRPLLVQYANPNACGRV